ncbi:MAG: NUDIX domain-containing protein [Jaaginema sp. PMC 1079.18]|nr:NUDIX domain-containing protein [Jaaginema sp. PMC 1080.18]MEC4852342.1 NUDIX domain-containing protein [Jaaginema sp. PMC 1079.18]MEC4867281.1 NUDIX domain-containing protein [Jaaginema sp. PMC 1078.18]
MTLAIIDDSWYQRPPNIPEDISAGGVVIRLEAQRLLIAVVTEGHLTKFVLPKGRLEKGESIEDAAYREVAEEAGLTDLKLMADLGSRERLDYSKKRWKKVYYFLFLTSQIEGIPTDTTHDYQLYWFDLEDLPPLFWPEQKEIIVNNRDRIRKLILP